MERTYSGTLQRHVSWATVNVVCVTYNNQDTVEALLDNLREQANAISEVVIHDNGSADETTRKVALWSEAHDDLRIKVIQSANVGFGAGIAGACASLSDQSLPTLCINPDAVLSSGTLDKMLEVLNSESSLGIVTAPLIRADGQLDTASVRTLPRFGTSLAYSIAGKLLPKRYRYNAFNLTHVLDETQGQYSRIQATTGALMLVSPLFRSSQGSIFDLDYWMYGEDLQLCKDAKAEGFQIAMIKWAPSLHLKGVSSGWPRGKVADRAFHDALFLYYAKNMSCGRLDRLAAKLAVEIKFLLSRGSAALARQIEKLTQP